MYVIIHSSEKPIARPRPQTGEKKRGGSIVGVLEGFGMHQLTYFLAKIMYLRWADHFPGWFLFFCDPQDFLLQIAVIVRIPKL